MKTLPVALQVYSIRDDAQKDFVKTMQEVKKMGYDGVELAGLYGHTPEEIRDNLNEIGLVPISAHVPYLELIGDLKGAVESYKTIGCRYVVIPYLTEDYRYGAENYTAVLNNIPVIAKACNEVGITLLYHNHDFEFAKNHEGIYILDSMYQQISEDELKTEIDTCWIKVAGEEPTEYIKKYAGRCPVVHLKDYNKAGTFEFRALGYGVQDIPAIIEASINAGAEWVVAEQDSHNEYTALEDARRSREYLKTLGW